MKTSPTYKVLNQKDLPLVLGNSYFLNLSRFNVLSPIQSAIKQMLLATSAFAISSYATATFSQTANLQADSSNSNKQAVNAILQDYSLLGNPLGRIWVTEDPVVLEPRLSVLSFDKAQVQNNKLVQAIQFNVYSNYFAFIKKAEIRVYANKDLDRLDAIKIIDIAFKPNQSQVNAEWDGQTNLTNFNFKAGDKLFYVLRVYDDKGSWDETQINTIDLANQIDYANTLEALKRSTELSVLKQGQSLGLSIENFTSALKNYGNSQIAKQNIVLAGSRVRIRGQDVPTGSSLRVNGELINIDTEQKFIAEYLMPIGNHQLLLEGEDSKGQKLSATLNAVVRSDYWVVLGMADVTHSKNTYTGQVEAVTAEDLARFSQSQTDARLAFYLKGKIKGRYLLTAQADTKEQDVKNLFKNFLKVDKTEVLKRLDPDSYYPVYGDDSITTKDVDTSGSLYVRLDWDKSSLIWGNVQTQLNDTQLSAYDRQLYGAKVAYRSVETTSLGDSKTQLRAFAAEQKTSPAKNEFLGTGGSLYYLKHADVVANSERITLETRDRDTGRTLKTYELKSGRDYEIDSFQGRIILTRPLLQITKDNNPIIDSPLDGNLNVVVVNYEFYPSSFDSENITAGLNFKQWIGENIAIGVNKVQEQRAGQDYELQGVDLTLQKGQGTYLKFEKAQSKSEAMPLFFSTDGGFIFNQQGQSLSNTTTANFNQLVGSSNLIELRVNAKEQGLTQNIWTISAWNKTKDGSFSGQHISQFGQLEKETGAELSGEISPELQLLASYKNFETTTQSFDPSNAQIIQTSANTDSIVKSDIGLKWQAQEDLSFQAYLQQADRINSQKKIAEKIIGVGVEKKVNPNVNVYASTQTGIGSQNTNSLNAYKLGSSIGFENGSSVSLEYTDTNNGSAVTAGAEYKRNPEHTIYGAYTFAPQSNNPVNSDSLIASKAFNPQSGYTIGQRLQMNSQWRMNQESQWIEDVKSKGQLNSLGLEFLPAKNWTISSSYQQGMVNSNEQKNQVQRRSISVGAAYVDSQTNWISKLENRTDKQEIFNDSATTLLRSNLAFNPSQQIQWLSTNKLSYKVSNHLRLFGQMNLSLTNTDFNNLPASEVKDAQLVDSQVGAAWRSANGKSNLLGKYQYLYDLAPISQVSSSANNYDQKSHIISFEGTYILNPQLELGGKLAQRQGFVRQDRGQGLWYKSNANYAAGQVRWFLNDRGVDEKGQTQNIWLGWSALAEYRLLKVSNGGLKKGFLLAIEKEISENTKLGLGYNFTDFSADLSQHSFKSKGPFVNFVWRFGGVTH